MRDFAYCSRGDDRGLFGTPVLLERVVEPGGHAAGRHGRCGAAGPLDRHAECQPRRAWRSLKTVLAQLQARADFDALDMPALLNALIADGAAIEVLYVHGHWRGVNDLEDFRRAVDFAHAQTPFGSAPDAAPPEAAR